MYEIIKNAQEYGLNRVFANSRDFIEQIEGLRAKREELKNEKDECDTSLPFTA